LRGFEPKQCGKIRSNAVRQDFLDIPLATICFEPNLKAVFLDNNKMELFRHAQDFFRRVRTFTQVPNGAYFEVREYGFCVKVRAMREKDKYV
jgi:hypothetical protein